MLDDRKITSSLPPEATENSHLPIYPCRKWRSGGVQLHLSHDVIYSQLEKLSYVKVDSVLNIPLAVLEEITWGPGFIIRMKEGSISSILRRAETLMEFRGPAHLTQIV